MKTYPIKQIIYQSPDKKDCIYTAENGVNIWDVTIDVGIGEEVYIALLSDLHYNYCNEEDFADADPVLMSTYEHRLWVRNAESVPTIRNCLAMTEDADIHIFNGDTLDYLSKGAMELMNREIWERYPECIATLGGHEISRQMQGKVPDTMSREEKLEILEAYWRHDIYYISKVIKNKVMIIGFLNDNGLQTLEQTEKLQADLQRARNNGYAVLLFAHEPIATNNPKHKSVGIADMLLPGDTSGLPHNYFDGTGNKDKVSLDFYDTIFHNADIIKGFFAGHAHNDFKLEILAKTPSGEDAVIPQFVHTSSLYGAGNFIRILVK